jgi:hypothetical protein
MEELVDELWGMFSLYTAKIKGCNFVLLPGTTAGLLGALGFMTLETTRVK